MTLDLRQIKEDLEEATSWSSHSGNGGELHSKAAEYISGLVDEVERLRAENTMLIVEAENLRSAIFRACDHLSAVADA